MMITFAKLIMIIVSTSSEKSQKRSKPVVIAITGASGSVLGFELIRALLKIGEFVELVLTEKAYPVIFTETGLKVSGNKALTLLQHLSMSEEYAPQLTVFDNHRLDAPPSSGTHWGELPMVLQIHLPHVLPMSH
jgi:3-polyprenyl-4-hydroxybenzoate decarboxylase